jgi:superfamily II DNA or RNA helicase
LQLGELLTGFDPRADVRGPQFERLCAWYLQNAPEYRSEIKRVYLWREWPGRWGIDAGIDLVAETHGGDLWAVQAKAYASTYSIKKSDIDSFMSESNRSCFGFRLLLATTDRLGANAARTIHAQEKPVGMQLLSQLRHAKVEWPANLATLEAPPQVRLDPMEHQLEAIEAAVDGLRKTDRGQLIMACGTGKTLTALWTDEMLSSRRTLVVVPSLALLGQTLRAWTAQAETPFQYQVVCSDQTVASEDNFTAWTADLGVPVTTDVATVRKFLSDPEPERRVVFSTYHSTPVVAAAQAAGGLPFDLVIADEAHRVAGNAESAFGTVLSSDEIRASKRLFMTATPRIVSRRVRASALERDVVITSMDDESRFGPVLHRLSFSEAIKRDLLTDYRIVVIGVDDPGIGRTVERRELVSAGDHVVDAETLARQVGVVRAVRQFDLKRLLTFHSRRATARAFARGLGAVVDWAPETVRPQGRLWARHITGDMSAGEREVILDQLRALEGVGWGVLANVRCVAEGVDVPTLDGVAFIDSRRSQTDVVQAVGRAIRKSPAKKLGIVLIPVFVPPDANDEDVLNSSDFRTVWAVVRALRAHDDVLAEQLDAARFHLGKRGGPSELPDKIILDLPRQISPEFAEALSARVVQRSTLSFEFYLGLLTRYAEEHGTVEGIKLHKQLDGYNLGQWITDQRQRFVRGVTTSDETRRLEALPGWTWEFRTQSKWNEWYELLLAWADEHGDVDKLPLKAPYRGRRLGEWVFIQQKMYVRGRLPEDRVARLKAVRGWVWSKTGVRWDERFELLERFVARKGHARVPRDHVEEGEPLGEWVKIQRDAYRGIKGRRLTKARAAKLQSLDGWTWDPQDARWEKGFERLGVYVEREKHARPPLGFMEGDFALGNWVSRQRYAQRKGWLQQERAARLEALPGWQWNPPKGGSRPGRRLGRVKKQAV